MKHIFLLIIVFFYSSQFLFAQDSIELREKVQGKNSTLLKGVFKSINYDQLINTNSTDIYEIEQILTEYLKLDDIYDRSKKVLKISSPYKIDFNSNQFSINLESKNIYFTDRLEKDTYLIKNYKLKKNVKYKGTSYFYNRILNFPITEDDEGFFLKYNAPHVWSYVANSRLDIDIKNLAFLEIKGDLSFWNSIYQTNFRFLDAKILGLSNIQKGIYAENSSILYNEDNDIITKRIYFDNNELNNFDKINEIIFFSKHLDFDITKYNIEIDAFYNDTEIKNEYYIPIIANKHLNIYEYFFNFGYIKNLTLNDEEIKINIGNELTKENILIEIADYDQIGLPYFFEYFKDTINLFYEKNNPYIANDLMFQYIDNIFQIQINKGDYSKIQKQLPDNFELDINPDTLSINCIENCSQFYFFISDNEDNAKIVHQDFKSKIELLPNIKKIIILNTQKSRLSEKFLDSYVYDDKIKNFVILRQKILTSIWIKSNILDSLSDEFKIKYKKEAGPSQWHFSFFTQFSESTKDQVFDIMFSNNLIAIDPLMLQKVIIKDPGDSNLFVSEVIDKNLLLEINLKLKQENKTLVKYETVFLGTSSDSNYDCFGDENLLNYSPVKDYSEGEEAISNPPSDYKVFINYNSKIIDERSLASEIDFVVNNICFDHSNIDLSQKVALKTSIVDKYLLNIITMNFVFLLILILLRKYLTNIIIVLFVLNAIFYVFNAGVITTLCTNFLLVTIFTYALIMIIRKIANIRHA